MSSRRAAPPSGDSLPRQQLQQQAAQLFEKASRSAEQGDIAASARLILEALDCERRAGGTAPQVLQLIKPRA